MQTDSVQLLPRLRSWRRIHWTVVGVMAIGLLVIYYEHRFSLPHSLARSWGWFWELFFFEYKSDVLGLLLLIPILYSALTLGWKQALVVTAVLLVAITPYIVDLAHTTLFKLTSYTAIVVPAVLAASLEIKLIADARERMAQEERKRQEAQIVRQRLRAQEDERKRIAQELHDGVAQSLLVTATLAHNLLERQAVADEPVRTDLESIKKNSLNLVSEVRAICQGLRPSILDNLGLVSALKWLADTTREEAGVDVEVALTGQAYELGPEKSLAVFRVVQEALNNVAKHAHASSIQIQLTFDETALHVSIDDDGNGFAVVDDVSRLAAGGRLGLLGMSERVQAVGGRLLVESREGLGTRVGVWVCPDT